MKKNGKENKANASETKFEADVTSKDEPVTFQKVLRIFYRFSIY